MILSPSSMLVGIFAKGRASVKSVDAPMREVAVG
jgi:hypothetical protein